MTIEDTDTATGKLHLGAGPEGLALSPTGKKTIDEEVPEKLNVHIARTGVLWQSHLAWEEAGCEVDEVCLGGQIPLPPALSAL